MDTWTHGLPVRVETIEIVELWWKCQSTMTYDTKLAI